MYITMSREIKFRAQRTDNQEWVYGYYFESPLTDENSGTEPEAGWFFLTGEKRHCIATKEGVVYVINPETVGQFTGLKDKNDKDLDWWAGDIVGYEGDPSRAVIVWHDGGWNLQYYENGKPNLTEDTKQEWFIRIDWFHKNHCIKLGNIYDNLELLTK